MLRSAVHFGAGNIGRGFLGPLYFGAGYATTFVDVDDALIAAMNTAGSYPLEIVDSDATTRETIGNARAVDARDANAVARAVAEADIVSTAVGAAVLPRIAPALARGIALRFASPGAAPLDIIVCENLLNAGPHLRELVRAALDPALHAALDARVGFVEASVGRMVPVRSAEERAADPLLARVEPYCRLPVDAEAFKGPVPAIAQLEPRPNFAGYVERKLFVHNLSHAATAYLGHLRGHTHIWEAIGDPAVCDAVTAATVESCEALARKHGLDRDELAAHAADLRERYGNRALGDQVARVAADPLRKLGPDDRLIGAARCALDQGVTPEAIAFAAAAAIRYDHPDDPGAATLQARRRADGLSGVLNHLCRVDPGATLGQLIAAGDERLQRGGWLARDDHARD